MIGILENPYRTKPRPKAFQIVLTNARRAIVSAFSNRALLFMKYPASRTIGGSNTRKKRVGVNVIFSDTYSAWPNAVVIPRVRYL